MKKSLINIDMFLFLINKMTFFLNYEISLKKGHFINEKKFHFINKMILLIK